MMYYYSTIDEVVTTHSGIEKDSQGFENVRVHFERPSKGGGFDFADLKMPDNLFYKAFGFSEDELMRMRRYAVNNSALIWEFASKGGMENA